MAEYRTVRQGTKKLMDRAEGLDVDFKKQASNLGAEEFVAFANSPSGGSLLIGVDEVTDAQGRQRGKIVGCRVDDEAKRLILDKAESCSPPINVTVDVENTNEKAFLRVDIPSGDKKPYCTRSGKYMTRGDGRKRPLLPTQLLSVFVREQAGEFEARFREATKSLQFDIDRLQDTVSERIEDVEYEMNKSLDPITSRLEGIFHSAQNAESLSDDAMNAASEAASETEGLRDKLQDLHQDVYHLAWKLNALLENFGVEDPEITRKRNYTRMFAELTFKTIAQRDKPGGGRYSVEEAEKAYDQYAERLSDRPEMRQRFLEYVTAEDVRR